MTPDELRRAFPSGTWTVSRQRLSLPGDRRMTKTPEEVRTLWLRGRRRLLQEGLKTTIETGTHRVRFPVQSSVLPAVRTTLDRPEAVVLPVVEVTFGLRWVHARGYLRSASFEVHYMGHTIDKGEVEVK